jgi:hypothetical protein
VDACIATEMPHAAGGRAGDINELKCERQVKEKRMRERGRERCRPTFRKSAQEKIFCNLHIQIYLAAAACCCFSACPILI